MMDEILLKDANGSSVPVFCPGATQVIKPNGGTAATNTVINAGDYQLVRVVADAAVNIAFAATAAATDMYLPADMIEYYIVPRNTKIAAYGTANVYITLHAN
jgi:hypothetical protein